MNQKPVILVTNEPSPWSHPTRPYLNPVFLLEWCALFCICISVLMCSCKRILFFKFASRGGGWGWQDCMGNVTHHSGEAGMGWGCQAFRCEWATSIRGVCVGGGAMPWGSGAVTLGFRERPLGFRGSHPGVEGQSPLGLGAITLGFSGSLPWG